MDGRRITASPLPCNGRRVVAKKRPRVGADGFVNSVKKLQRREIGSKRNRIFRTCDAQERFRNIRLQEEYDTHDPDERWARIFPCLGFLQRRSKIIDIVAASDLIFALAESGVCVAFSRETNQRKCFLNISPDEVIRSLFYNKINDSLITVSVYALCDFRNMSCRSRKIEYFQRGEPASGLVIFRSESFKYPGFVEFDDVNGKALTFSAENSIYKVFELENYTLLYSLSEKNVNQIKMSPGIMLITYKKPSTRVRVKILSIEDGAVLKSFNHPLHRKKKLDFIEHFNNKLLVKQENENLQILDVHNFDVTEVSSAEFGTPSAFIFLYEKNIFLTSRNRTVDVWNFRGELVSSFGDHLANTVHITSDLELIISYCKPEFDYGSTQDGYISISNILTGKRLAKIDAESSAPLDECSSWAKCSATHALEDITALFYDEKRNEIYTGNSVGLVHVWSS